MVVYIKNMVCVRCKMAVQSVLQMLGIAYQSIELGKLVVPKLLSGDQLRQLDQGLHHYELELMEDKYKILTERIKTLLINLLHQEEIPRGLKLSVFLSEQLHYNYTHLANIFSETEGITLEHFYIAQKIERVKELILYEDITIKEISYLLQYSSPSHLCQQFKKVTELTPAMFRKRSLNGELVWKRSS